MTSRPAPRTSSVIQRSRCRRRHRGTRGISIIEVLTGTALTLMICLGIVSFQKAQHAALAAQNVFAQSQSVTRTLIDLMSRELRMASYDPTGLAITNSVNAAWCLGWEQGIVEATASRLRFRQDLNANGVIGGAGTGEDVTYELVSGQIRRIDGAGTPVVIADNVPTNGLRFRYFNAGNPPVEYVPGTGALTQGQRDCVSKVRITAAVRRPHASANTLTPLESVAESEISIRNRTLLVAF